MSDTKRRVSNRSIKRKSTSEEIKEVTKTPKKVRQCDKSGCAEIEPSCSLLINGCTESGYTSRWYHMSLGEHFCNNCFDNMYRPGRKDNLHFNDWSNQWVRVARVTKPTIKRFVANELLPYWVKCSDLECGKWRSVRKSDLLDSNFIKKFKCSLSSKSCKDPEDKLVTFASNPYFINQLAEAPLLKNSPAGPYLKRFLPEDIGLCPITCSSSSLNAIDDMEPFSQYQGGESSIWPMPDFLDEDETLFVSNTLISRATYLGIRNLIVVLWNLSPKEWLDVNKVNMYLICRGLVRIHLLSLVEHVLKLLTRKSVINYGILENPLLTISKKSNSKVLIIGAGISGLVAGKHLQNLGLDVTLYEANSNIGGRVRDNQIPTFIIQGLLNNPLKILAIQADVEYQILNGNVVIFDSKGKPISKELERNTQHLLRGIAQGALDKSLQNKKDSNWYDAITDSFKTFNAESGFKDSKLFHHLLSLFELELKADFRELTLLNWEAVTSLKGNNAFSPVGINCMLEKLAKNLNIIYDNKVTEIDYSSERVKVVSSREISLFSCVLITVPLPVLRENLITFVPPLPEFKQKAFQGIGDYFRAKLIMQFPKKFWIGSYQKPFMEFSIVTEDQIFRLFLDLTVDKKKSLPTLVAFLSLRACEILKEKSDREVLEMCLKLLKNTFFPNKSIPSPSKWFLTDRNLANPECSYGSYIKVGNKSSLFDDVAKTVEDKLFFAGEATFRNLPCSMTGAFLSGLREAANILKRFDPV